MRPNWILLQPDTNKTIQSTVHHRVLLAVIDHIVSIKAYLKKVA